MKLQKSGQGYHLSIPKAIVEAYNWNKGQELKIEIASNKSLIVKEK